MSRGILNAQTITEAQKGIRRCHIWDLCIRARLASSRLASTRDAYGERLDLFQNNMVFRMTARSES